ncbi:endonuclease [Bacillus phage SP-15]|uniref:Endonuclease n=1 Tax=Bacillus phage SP-15 TaxID=1792032 RepID=A0A127AWE2_9CAUD|nr:endonuclease [Bacillus phage SP-15]AMM44902.1 endonuclease [Bacillus phage SP-15]
MIEWNIEELSRDPEYGKSYVVCPVCGLRGKRIANHIRAVHGLSGDEAKGKYPGLLTITSSSRTKQASTRKTTTAKKNEKKIKNKFISLDEAKLDPQYGKKYVVCPICNQKCKSVSAHAPKKHGVKLKDIRKEYPGILVETEAMFNRRSKILAKRWEEDDEYRAMMINMMTNREVSEDTRRKISERVSIQMKERWRDPVYREYYSERLRQFNRDNWNNPEYRELMAQALSDRWDDPEYRELMISNLHAGRNKSWLENKEARLEALREGGFFDKSSPEVRQKISEIMLEKWADEEYASSQIDAIANGNYGAHQQGLHGRKCYYIDRKGDTHKFQSLRELQYAIYLDSVGIEWKSSKDIKKLPYKDQSGGSHRYTADFYHGGHYIDIKGWRSSAVNHKMEDAARRNGVIVIPIDADRLDEFCPVKYFSLISRVRHNDTVNYVSCIKWS